MNAQFASLLVLISLLCYSTAGNELEPRANVYGSSALNTWPSSLTAIRTYVYGTSTTKWTPIVTTVHPTCPECTDTRMPSCTETLSAGPGGYQAGTASSYVTKPTSVSVTLPLVSGTSTIWSQTPSSSTSVHTNSTLTSMANSSSQSITSMSTSTSKPPSSSTSAATPSTSTPASAGNASDLKGIMVIVYAFAGLCVVGGYMLAM